MIISTSTDQLHEKRMPSVRLVLSSPPAVFCDLVMAKLLLATQCCPHLIGSLSMGSLHKNAQLWLGQEISLQFHGTNEAYSVDIFVGAIATIKLGLTASRIAAYGTTDKLLHTFLNHTYERMSSGAIARDLAEKADLEVASAEEGITFPAYVIDDRRSAFHHLHDIAVLCGFDFYSNAAGQLVFQAFKGGNAVHVLEYGTHILQLDIQQSSPSASRFEAWGESPGGSRGDKAWSWLTKDFTPSRGLAGDGTPSRLLERAVLRTADAAGLAAQAAHAASIRHSLRGRVLLPGRPEIQLGDAIRFLKLPNPDYNATFQVRAITHRLGRRHGFTTAVDFQRIP